MDKRDERLERYPWFEKYGQEYGDGWLDIVEKMCNEIRNKWAALNKKVNLSLFRIKDENGCLKINVGSHVPSFEYYKYYRDKDGLLYTKDEIDKWFYPINVPNHLPPKKSDLPNIIEILQRYQKLATKTCDECGMPGSERKSNIRTWIKCDKCWGKNKRLQK